MDVIEISKRNTKGFFSTFDTLNTATKNKVETTLRVCCTHEISAAHTPSVLAVES